jgi:hypothetical protein
MDQLDIGIRLKSGNSATRTHPAPLILLANLRPDHVARSRRTTSEVGAHRYCVAELCRSWIKRRRCAAPGPALPAPGSALGRPARRARAVPPGSSADMARLFSALAGKHAALVSLPIVQLAAAAQGRALRASLALAAGSCPVRRGLALFTLCVRRL